MKTDFTDEPENNLVPQSTNEKHKQIMALNDRNLIKDFEDPNQTNCYKNCLICCGQKVKIMQCICACCGGGPIVTIQEGHVGLKTEFGQFTKKLPPGLYSFNPYTEKIVSVDMRAQVIDVGLQRLLTKDNVTLMVDAYVNFSITHPEKAVFKILDYRSLMIFLTHGAMKSIVAEHTLSEMLVNRKIIEKKLTHIIDEKTHPFGLVVHTIETQRIQLPKEMERAMATVAESEKQSEARLIDAKGNLESAKVFKKAADVLNENEISLQLQYFETLKMIASEHHSTIVVPDSILEQTREAKKERLKL